MDITTFETLNHEWSPQEPSQTRRFKAILPQFYAALAIFSVNLSHEILEHTMFMVIFTMDIKMSPLVVQNVLTWIALIIGGIVAQITGGRLIVMLAGAVSVVGWITVGCISSETVLLWAYCILVFTKGMVQAPAYVYLAEISQPNMRNVIMAAMCMSVKIGSIYSNVMGMKSTKVAAPINVVFALFGVIVAYFLPDSPYWLANKGRYHGVESSLAWFRGKTTVENVKSESKAIIGNAQNSPVAWKVFGQKSLRIAALIVCSVFLANAFVRIFYIMHLPDIQIISSNPRYHDSFVVVWSILNVYLSIFFVSLVSVIGKRIIILVFSFGACMALFAACISCYLYENNFINSDDYSWFLLICPVLVHVCVIIGTEPVTLLLNGELFPSKLRNLGAGFGLFFVYAVQTVSHNLYFRFFASEDSGLLFLAVVSLIGFMSLFCLFPRNENKSLVEIEQSSTSINELKIKK